MSTGVIGQHLPITSILSAISSLNPTSSLSSMFSAWESAAQAFMTTDTFSKLRSLGTQVSDRGQDISESAVCADNIHPALVKTASYGEDANWGRILAATGSVPLSPEIKPARVSVAFVPADGSARLRI
ncbi:hypothetical protein M378DRAFT_16293 [Amanita muscaria Koide BX008]|uniref:Glutamate N-acetyltransferase n=1 Tax=Amanita muscaria (strain Koide BX008) TaxID=946122 RepID=A0A0C2WMF5_AMAMK|nr:hypothetical protein M378DRAFT_16293 [Amanita muscaria Koide BX008]